MRVTISHEDNIVIVNGTPLSVDCSDLPSHIRVIQWDGTTGWIEFTPASDGRFVPNLKIIDFKLYSYLVDRWRLALAERVAAEKENKARAIEEEIKRIETNKQQAEAMKLAAIAAVELAEQQRAEKQAIAEKITTLTTRYVEQEARIKELETRLESIRAGSTSA